MTGLLVLAALAGWWVSRVDSYQRYGYSSPVLMMDSQNRPVIVCSYLDNLDTLMIIRWADGAWSYEFERPLTNPPSMLLLFPLWARSRPA